MGIRRKKLYINLFLPGISGLLAFLRNSSVGLLVRERFGSYFLLDTYPNTLQAKC